MATRSVSRNDLVGTNSLSFIRPQRLAFSVKDTKPSTVLYPFFDGQPVGVYVTPAGGSLGGTLTTNAAGSISGTFDIPPAAFNTGNRTFRLQDSPDFDDTAIPGSTVGSASAVFSASGLRQTWQQTITNTTTVEVNIVDSPPAPTPFFSTFQQGDQPGDGGGLGDPLAQTFFTYGVKGGCYITKIDLYFQSKDANIPVVCQLRNVVNGYPGPIIISPYASVSLPPSMVNVSDDASAVTTFTFSRPIYLEEDKDYCFVMLSNSNSYNMWTSRFGEKSIETGKTIFEQPFIGTLFKSENNITWTAEQTEDIKFTLYKAAFDTTSRAITYKANSPSMLILGSAMSVTNGSSIVTVTTPFMHGQRTGDRVAFEGISAGNYRGIPSATISNPLGFIVTVVDTYSFTFNVGTNATSTGSLSASGIVNAIAIENGGSGYTSPTVAITGGGGSGATATLTVVAGVIIGATITNAGTGFTSTPTAVVTDSMGSPGVGAIVTAISEAIFVTNMNRKFQDATPVLFTNQPPGTRVVNSLRTSGEDYVVGAHEFSPINRTTSVGKEAVIVNSLVETNSFGSNASTEMIIRLESDNPNVSPMIDINETPRLRLNNNIVNNDQTNEILSTGGLSYSRYISKAISLATLSKGVRVTVTAASILTTGFDVYIRTSKTGSSVSHKSLGWTILNCDVERNLSTTLSEFKDYEFYLDNIVPFDVYDIKIVLQSSHKHLVPKIANYRLTILAT
jgi:hypothetical protein